MREMSVTVLHLPVTMCYLLHSKSKLKKKKLKWDSGGSVMLNPYSLRIKLQQAVEML